ncbi:MAG TPA: hypothetical protein VFW44_14975 [Bryobacteraceae bacterium]|nr:hypothetical protein [Bryobacteraceae bacterium]
MSECLEDQRLFGRRDADAGIADAEMKQIRGFGGALNGHRNVAAAGKFDRIADQVDQDLSQAPAVAANAIRHIRLHVPGQVQPFGARWHLQPFEHLHHEFAEAEFARFQPHFAGFDLRDVQDVVDDGE